MRQIPFPTLPVRPTKGCALFSDVRAVSSIATTLCGPHQEPSSQTRTRVPKIYISTAPGSGKGNNLRNLIGKGSSSQAKAVVVVDADAQTLTPGMGDEHLGEPLFKVLGLSHLSMSSTSDEGLVRPMKSPTLWSGLFWGEGSVNPLEWISD